MLRDILPADPQGRSFDAVLDDMIAWADRKGLTGQNLGMAALEPAFWEVVHSAMTAERRAGKRSTPRPQREPQTFDELVAMKPGRSRPTNHRDAQRKHAANPSLNTLADLME